MSAETQYTANTGFATINRPNTSLTGSGTLSYDIWDILLAASNGTFIKTVTIKSQGKTVQGMIRLFIYNGTYTRLFKEIEIPDITQTATAPAFEITIPINFTLQSGWNLRATSDQSGTFNIIVEGQNWAYYGASVRADTTKFAPKNTMANIATGNSLLDGSGTTATILTSSGCNVLSITIKATGNTTAGMVRFFLYDGTYTKLLTEVPVDATTQSGTSQAFYHKIVFNDGFALKSGWTIKASTQNSESFNILSESVDWSYYA